MVTPLKTKNKDKKTRQPRRKYVFANGHRVTQLQVQSGYNQKRYRKRGYILYVPKTTIIDKFSLKQRDRFAWRVVNNESPLVLELTKLESGVYE